MSLINTLFSRKKQVQEISDVEISELITSIEQIETYPSSQRLFQELFEKSQLILSQYGERRGLFNRTIFYENSPPDWNKIILVYQKTFPIFEGMFILIDTPKIAKEVEMAREKGNLTHRFVENASDAELLSRGYQEIRRGLDTYEPVGFYIWDRLKQSEVHHEF
jgi:hypothetical protein